MPISHKKKIIFVHIPKNAGTSIIESKDLEFSGVEHQSFLSYKSSYPLEWKNYLKTAIVRNPWDRFVSSYEYARMPESYWHSNEENCQAKFGKHPDYIQAKNICFEDFVRKFFYKELNLSHFCWAPQKDWICEGKNIMIDETFRFEDIEVNCRFKSIFGNIGKLNQSKRSDYKSYYKTKESIEIVGECYKEDIEIFNYSF